MMMIVEVDGKLPGAAAPDPILPLLPLLCPWSHVTVSHPLGSGIVDCHCSWVTVLLA